MVVSTFCVGSAVMNIYEGSEQIPERKGDPWSTPGGVGRGPRHLCFLRIKRSVEVVTLFSDVTFLAHL